MKTPEEIKQGLEYCQQSENNMDCMGCIYLGDCLETHCYAPIASDALAYIQLLEKERDKYKALFEKTYDELEVANKALDGAQNCTNCAYGNGTITETSYCYDCKWFTEEATRIKWTEEKRDEDIRPRKCPYCGYMAGVRVLRRCCTKFWKKQYWVQCVLCGYYTKKAFTKRGAIKKWNRRVRDD